MANCMEKYSKYDLAMYKKNIDNDIDIQGMYLDFHVIVFILIFYNMYVLYNYNDDCIVQPKLP